MTSARLNTLAVASSPSGRMAQSISPPSSASVSGPGGSRMRWASRRSRSTEGDQPASCSSLRQRAMSRPSGSKRLALRVSRAATPRARGLFQPPRDSTWASISALRLECSSSTSSGIPLRRQCRREPERPGVGLDAPAQLHRPAGRGQAAHRGRRLQLVTPQGGVRRLPAPGAVVHLEEVGDQHVVVRARVARPGRGMAGVGVDEPAGGRRRPRPAPTAPAGPGHLVEVGQGGVALGVEQAVHDLAQVDHPELGDGLVGRDDELHPWTARPHQPDTRGRVLRPAGGEERLVLGRRHGSALPEA